MSGQTPSTLAARLRHVRAIGGITQARTGDVAGVSQQLVSLLEAGHRGKQPSHEHISKIASVFGVSADWLVSGTGPKPAAKRVKAAVERALAKAASAPEAAQ